MDREDKIQLLINILFVICAIADYIYGFTAIEDPVMRHFNNMIVFYGVMTYSNVAF